MKILITGGAGFVGSHVAEYYAKKDDEVVVFDNRPSDQKVYISDITKAKKILGWKPKVSLEEGLERTIEWFREK